MMDRETEGKGVSEVTVLLQVEFLVRLDRLGDCLLLDDRITNELGRFHRLLAWVDKDKHLVLASLVEHFLVADPLDGLPLRGAKKLLLECTGVVGCTDVVKSFRLVHAKESGDIREVW